MKNKQNKTKKEQRIKMNFTISESSFDKIEKYIAYNCLNRSVFVEKLLVDFINKQQK